MREKTLEKKVHKEGEELILLKDLLLSSSDTLSRVPALMYGFRMRRGERRFVNSI